MRNDYSLSIVSVQQCNLSWAIHEKNLKLSIHEKKFQLEGWYEDIDNLFNIFRFQFQLAIQEINNWIHSGLGIWT